MNFIRNIISEKRAARPMAPPLSAPHDEGQSWDDSNADHFETTRTISDVQTDLSAHATAGAPINIFAAQDVSENLGPVENWEPRYPDADHPGADARNGDFASVDATAEPTLDLPAYETGHDRRLSLAWPAEEAFDAAPEAPLLLTVPAAPAFHPIHEPANQRSLNDMPFVNVQPTQQPDAILTDAGVQMPPPAMGRGASRTGRVKTRLLGFNADSLGLANPFEKEESRASDAFPVGWLVVVAGPGLGAAFALHDGVSRIGRGDDQTVSLNFGDNSISRENHLSIAFDPEQNAFYIGQSGRSNIVRLNNKPLLSTEQVRSGDQVRVGETTLRLVALCGDEFSWAAKV